MEGSQLRPREEQPLPTRQAALELRLFRMPQEDEDWQGQDRRALQAFGHDLRGLPHSDIRRGSHTESP